LFVLYITLTTAEHLNAEKEECSPNALRREERLLDVNKLPNYN